MLHHTGFVVTDLAKARIFYDSIARPLGLKTQTVGDKAFMLMPADGGVPRLWIGTQKPSYWAPGSRPGINQMHLAFLAPSHEVVKEFHRVGLEAGGRDNGRPGPRKGVSDYYGAFLLDPDGNNIEACAPVQSG
jgi:catechol 2,3-dioxygenase-like lactoylglutathione lyase family enzyme